MDKVTKAASKSTFEAARKLMMSLGTDETSIQPVPIPKERNISP